ncbi:PTS glucose transporter subunit IIA [Clostridium sp. 19966]|uniref:PTS sugar transporter subunit IIA n=1 Tax=Clostridium sp. 19966 TaxID=2768166 RepID=UPI0028DD6B93|nr:PTS glucose transporter subunit IIA [Clostridium sp. 19966]MDT8717874.1 PTS glucose transporter subunit IIA [Clostridium sp. 19966]
MFNLLKNKSNKEIKLIAPITGKTIDISEVPDEVFSQKMLGDGIAIKPTGDLIVAPANGKITLILKSLHAFVLTLANGTELLVHIGLDTVSLNGEGFEQLVEEGTNVKAGTPVIKINRDFILSKGLSLISPIVITNMDTIKKLTPYTDKDVISGQDEIININF